MHSQFTFRPSGLGDFLGLDKVFENEVSFNKITEMFAEEGFKKTNKSMYTRSRFKGYSKHSPEWLKEVHDGILSRENNPETRKYKSLVISWSERKVSRHFCLC